MLRYEFCILLSMGSLTMKYDLSQYELSAEQVGELIRKATWTIRRLAREGKLPAIKPGRDWLFCKEEIVKHINGLTEETVINNTESFHEKRDTGECDIFS